MNETRTFDRLARAWLDLMPNEAPDRVIAAVLQAAETTPQVRPSLGLVIRRFPQMNRFPVLVAAAATLVVVVGAALVLNPGPKVGAPSTSPGASPTDSPLPASLTHSWMAGPKGVPRTLPDAGTIMAFTTTGSFAARQSNLGNEPHLSSFARIAPDGRLRLSGVTNEACQVTDTGLYTWTVSSDGRRLSITTGEDTCAVRSTVLIGDWFLDACRAPQDSCLGEMDAGTYSSQYVRPLLASGAQWAPKYAGVTFTVPAGWANWSDWPGTFGLGLASDFATTTAQEPGPARSLELLADVAVPRLGVGPCQDDRDPAARTPAAMIDRLRNLPGLVVGPATAITVGGFSGQWVDLTVDDAAVVPCGTERIVGYLMQGGEGQAIGLGARVRLILLQSPSDLVIGFRIESDVSAFDAFAAQAMPIIQTFQFN